MRVSPLVVLVGYGTFSVHGIDTTSAPLVEATETRCEGLLKLCTDDAIISGSSLQLTYVCPLTTKGSTRTVTQTSTLTVTITPSVEVTVTEEPTITTTITSGKSTLFLTKTVSLASKVTLPESSDTVKVPSATSVVGVPISTTDGVVLTSSAPVTMSPGYYWPTPTVDLSKTLFPTMTVSGTGGIFFTRTQGSSSYVATGAGSFVGTGTGSFIATGTITYSPTGTFSTSVPAAMVTSLEPTTTAPNEMSILPIFPPWTNSSVATLIPSSSSEGYAMPTMMTTAPLRTLVLPANVTFNPSINTIFKRADSNIGEADTIIYTSETTSTTTTTITIYLKTTTTVPTGSAFASSTPPATATATHTHKPDSLTDEPGAVTQHLGTNSANTAHTGTMMAILFGLAVAVFAHA